MAQCEDLADEVSGLATRTAILETNRERDVELLRDLQKQISEVARDVSEIKIALARGRGGIGVALWLIAGLGGASGWAMVIYNILKSNARIAP